MVGPRVAAAAAQAALATLTQKDPGPRLAANTSTILDDPGVHQPVSVQLPDRFSTCSLCRVIFSFTVDSRFYSYLTITVLLNKVMIFDYIVNHNKL